MKYFTVVLEVCHFIFGFVGIFFLFFYFKKLLKTVLTLITVRHNHNAKQRKT